MYVGFVITVFLLLPYYYAQNITVVLYFGVCEEEFLSQHYRLIELQTFQHFLVLQC